MARYIDETLVNAKLKEICENTATTYGIVYGGRAEKFERLTEDIPTADVVEVKHGYWKFSGNEKKCSVCGFVYYSNNDKWNGCPNCLSKMDG